MNTQIRKTMVEQIMESINIPDSAYDAAQMRYDDLGKWLEQSPQSKSARFSPHVFPQGSFRLGTAIRPWGRDDYDLDLSCKLQEGITRENFTQEKLKELLGTDLETYRQEKGIQETLKRKHRCWRLLYKDQLRFHIDTVPCIPARDDIKMALRERMIKAGSKEYLADEVTQLAVSITDDREPSYKVISSNWNISNPEGYARWFESKMRQATKLLDSRAMMEKVAKVDDLPTYKWRTPLQQCVQILKRHRDIMFEQGSDGKPISIIITTLAAKAYQGEGDIEEAMQVILSQMAGLILPNIPRVPNPVNTEEDFADKWRTAEGRRLRLEENFWKWLDCAKADFGALGSSEDAEHLAVLALGKFGAALNSSDLRKKLGQRPSVGPEIIHKSPEPSGFAPRAPWCADYDDRLR